MDGKNTSLAPSASTCSAEIFFSIPQKEKHPRRFKRGLSRVVRCQNINREVKVEPSEELQQLGRLSHRFRRNRKKRQSIILNQTLVKANEEPLIIIK